MKIFIQHIFEDSDFSARLQKLDLKEIDVPADISHVGSSSIPSNVFKKYI